MWTMYHVTQSIFTNYFGIGTMSHAAYVLKTLKECVGEGWRTAGLILICNWQEGAEFELSALHGAAAGMLFKCDGSF